MTDDTDKIVPTTEDTHLAEAWYELFRSGEASKEDLARVLSSTRSDVNLVQRLEAEIVRYREIVASYEKHNTDSLDLRHEK